MAAIHELREQTITRLLNDRSAATYIGVSVHYLRKCRSEGARRNRTIGPPFVKFGRSVRYDIDDLNAWIETNKRRPAATD